MMNLVEKRANMFHEQPTPSRGIIHILKSSRKWGITLLIFE